jgi:hypothetical protein
MSVALDKVEAPDVIGSLRPQTKARAVVEPQPGTRLVFLGNLEPLTAPDALHPIPPNSPADPLQQSGDTPIAIPPILRSEGDDGLGQGIFVGPEDGLITLGPTGLTDDAAGVALREAILLPDAGHGLPAPLGAYKFPCEMSLRICFSRERSATSRRNRAFSRSRSFVSIRRRPRNLRSRRGRVAAWRSTTTRSTRPSLPCCG